MPFFENLSKKVGEAAQTAAKKSNEFIEVNKLNSSINAEQDTIKKIHEQIGRIIYENYCLNPENVVDSSELCEQIKVHEDNIKNLETKISEIKKVKTCPQCRSEITGNKAFCPKCGAKLTVENETVNEQQAETQFCPSCGAELEDGVTFCGSCGQKIE